MITTYCIQRKELADKSIVRRTADCTVVSLSGVFHCHFVLNVLIKHNAQHSYNNINDFNFSILRTIGNELCMTMLFYYAHMNSLFTSQLI